MLQGFRSAWLSANLPLLVLKLLRESALSEWEIVSRLDARYGLNPDTREFGRVEDSLLEKGFATRDTRPGANKLQITMEGIRLLSRIEDEYRAVVENTGRPQGTS